MLRIKFSAGRQFSASKSASSPSAKPSEDNPVRVVDLFVDGLDLNKLQFISKGKATEGRPAFDNKVLLKLYVYGYLNRIRTSRLLERECERNIEVMWLIK